MARGSIKVGDEVMATVIKRVTDDRISVSIPSYNFHHSIEVVKGQPIELISGKVTVTLGTTDTVDQDKVRLLQSYVPPTRNKALIDGAD
ncbi:hypothetical protein GCM10007881_34760 [Mesorhizobium huakuii]|uniref:hypothetical protein n=1 Tax=Mesorhizobium TaxID=68287 RepID=UPI001F0AB89B|nr:MULTISPECIES: hypothetical protein [Mesorhizobium]MCH4561163.1 hypothetical protein [Mesorhizobium jarvisii]GLQ79957.1 hypothetical protein GCM10007881_34760 [Mesorhizobium huakuii]